MASRSAPVVCTAEPRVEEEGLRRKRGGTLSSSAIGAELAKEDAETSKPLLGIIAAVVVFVVAFLAFRYLW